MPSLVRSQTKQTLKTRTVTTKIIWSRLSGGLVTDSDAHEIASNTRGFFETLSDWSLQTLEGKSHNERKSVRKERS